MDKEIKIELTTNDLKLSATQALSDVRPYGKDFFGTLRIKFASNLTKRLNNAGYSDLLVEPEAPSPKRPDKKQVRIPKNSDLANLDWEFCFRYGFGEYSFNALNWNKNGLVELPSFESLFLSPRLYIGNFRIKVNADITDVDVLVGQGLCYSGLVIQNRKTPKSSSYIYLLGIEFSTKALESIKNKTPQKTCKHQASDLEEIRFPIASFPIFFICRHCGTIVTCQCFEGYYNLKEEVIRILQRKDDHVLRALKAHVIKAGICHLCTGKTPKLLYGHKMYYSSFLQRYRPYFHLFSRIYPSLDEKELENKLREKFSYPLIGQKWISETLLYNLVKTIFSPLEVVHHYRGKELERLELDIWIPEIKLGIEYQGEQHFKEVSVWGGKNGLKKRIENDKKKKKICRRLGYTLIEFKFSDEITEELAYRKLLKFIKLMRLNKKE